MLALMRFVRLAVEANEVIGLGLMKIASGGPDSLAEIHLMIAEKLHAATEAGTSLILGQSPVAVVERYREHVANNQRRLSE